MSRFSSAAAVGWLERPVFHDRVPVRRRQAWKTGLEIAVLAVAIWVIAIDIIF
jgi:hypothetical protein